MGSRPPPGRLALPGLMESADDAAEDLQSVSTPVRNDPVDEAEDVKDEGPERMKSRRAGTGKMEKFWDPLVQRVNTQNEKDVEEVLVETRIYEMIVFAWPLEYLSLSAIILNAIVIGLETDIMSQQLLTDPPHEFVILGWVFCTFFTLEMVLKISANPSRFFTGTGWQMNVFDLVLVALQWLDVLLTALAADDQNQNTTNFNVMRVIRMVRLVRIVRSYRVLRMLGEVRAIVWSVGTSFKPLLGAMLVLAGVIYLMAVYLVDTCNAYRVTLGSADPGFEPLGQFFGSVPGGMLTLWQAMTGGIDWSTVMNPLLAYTSPLAVIIFLFYIAFSLLALLNLITGVFVESAVKRGKEDKDSYLVQYVRGVFKKMEKSNSGIITWDDFQASLHSKDIKELFKAIDLDISEAHCVFKILDLDDDGTLDADEFLSGCLRLRGPAKALDVLVLMREIRTMQTQLMALYQFSTPIAALEFPAVQKSLTGSHGSHGSKGGDSIGDEVELVTPPKKAARTVRRRPLTTMDVDVCFQICLPQQGYVVCMMRSGIAPRPFQEIPGASVLAQCVAWKCVASLVVWPEICFTTRY
ncbi:unnamed protein product [Effrenium voratum]|nr:unnamed protein product [Effrenium voratum]